MNITKSQKLIVFNLLLAVGLLFQVFATATISTSVSILGALVPDDDGNATLSGDTCQLLVDSTADVLSVTVESTCANPSISFAPLITDGSGEIPRIVVSSENAEGVQVLFLPTVVTSSSPTWDGVIQLPTVTSFTLPTASGETRTLSAAIALGVTDSKLYFEDAVRILFPHDKKKRAAFADVNSDFDEIIDKCDNDTGEGLGVDAECKIKVGGDLAIWTRHFTKFATFKSKSTKKNNKSSSDEDSEVAVEETSFFGGVVNFVENAIDDIVESEEETTDIDKKLFDIALTIDSNLIRSLDELVAKTEFISFGNVATYVDLVYRIENENGEVVLTQQGNVTVETEKIVTREFKGLELPDGNYTLFLTTTYGDNVVDEFKQSFEIYGSKMPLGVKIALTSGVLILFTVGGMFFVKAKKKKNVDVASELKVS